MENEPDQPAAGESPAPAQAPTTANSDLQFDKVEGAAPDAGRTCALCQRYLADEYFERGGRVICPACANERGGSKGGGGLFLRAAMFGGAAALVGSIVWFLIVKITDYELGLIAIGVGVLVGRAVQRGARGRGGWKYQLLAMVLTYSSITVSKVPFVLKGMAQAVEENKKKTETADAAGATNGPATLDPASAAKQKPLGAGEAIRALFLFAVIIIGIALASPFLAGAQNFMGIMIIGIALYEAWKINKRVPVNGPFRMGATPAFAAGAVAGMVPPPQAP